MRNVEIIRNVFALLTIVLLPVGMFLAYGLPVALIMTGILCAFMAIVCTIYIVEVETTHDRM